MDSITSESMAYTFKASLPAQCQPANELLLRLSSTFHTCVPSNLALASTVLGSLSIAAWLFAQVPQVYKNFKLQSTSGLSIYFLTEWLLGDLTNLLGCLFTGQATWQIILAAYYCFVDCCLMGQYIWYEGLHHGRPLRRVWWPKSKAETDVIDGVSIYSTSTMDAETSSIASKPIDFPTHGTLKPEDIRGQFRMPRYSSSPGIASLTSSLSSSPNRATRIPTGASPMPSPRTVVYMTILLAIVTRASPVQTAQQSRDHAGQSSIQLAGTILSWISTVMYLGSRLPQIYKNHIRRSTSGLSPELFIAAFFGNLFYSTSMLTNPNVWFNYGPFGGGGWVGEEGNDRATWIARAAPFFLGAAGVLVMDGCIGLQFLCYGEETPAPVVVVEERQGRKWRWRRVSGWMRGWMPSPSAAGTPRLGTPTGRSASEPGRQDETAGLLAQSSESRSYGVL